VCVDDSGESVGWTDERMQRVDQMEVSKSLWVEFFRSLSGARCVLLLFDAPHDTIHLLLVTQP
jgi:hypothetical protein